MKKALICTIFVFLLFPLSACASQEKEQSSPTEVSEIVVNTTEAIPVTTAEVLPDVAFEYSINEIGLTITGFEGSLPSNLEIPGEINGVTVTEIDYYAFYNNGVLRRVVIPEGVTRIGGSAFYGCNALVDVTIPDSVTIIEGYAFTGTPWLNLLKDEFSVFGDGILLKYNGNDTYVEIPSEVKRLSGAFQGCANLVGVTIPDSVTEIGPASFSGCSKLKDITIPDSVTNIGVEAFAYCDSLTKITLPRSVTWVESAAFAGCTNLREVNVVDPKVTQISFEAFLGCKNLKSMPATVGSLY